MNKLFILLAISTFIVANANAIEPPENLRAPASVTSGGFVLEWDAVPGAAQYRVFQSINGSSFAQTTVTTGTSASLSRVDAIYEYKVKSCTNTSSASCGIFSDIVEVFVDECHQLRDGPFGRYRTGAVVFRTQQCFFIELDPSKSVLMGVSNTTDRTQIASLRDEKPGIPRTIVQQYANANSDLATRSGQPVITGHRLRFTPIGMGHVKPQVAMILHDVETQTVSVAFIEGDG